MLDLDIKHQFSNSRFRLLSKDDRWGHEGITLVKLFGKIQERTEYTLIMLFFFFLRILINFWLVVCGLFSSWSCCRLRASGCGASPVAERGLSGTRSSVAADPGRWSTGSAVVAHSRWDLPRAESNPHLPQWQADSSPTEPPGKPYNALWM